MIDYDVPFSVSPFEEMLQKFKSVPGCHPSLPGHLLHEPGLLDGGPGDVNS